MFFVHIRMILMYNYEEAEGYKARAGFLVYSNCNLFGQVHCQRGTLTNDSLER